MSVKVYVDGQAGTTGLKIIDRLNGRNDIELLKIADEDRHNNDARRAMMEQADFTFLCLPDAASIEAVELAKGFDEPETVSFINGILGSFVQGLGAAATEE